MATGFRDEKYKIEAEAEVDDFFATVVKEVVDYSEKSRRGRDSVRKAAILVLASTKVFQLRDKNAIVQIVVHHSLKCFNGRSQKRITQ